MTRIYPLNGSEIKTSAQKISQHIITKKDGISNSARETSSLEREIIYRIAHGALLGMYHSQHINDYECTWHYIIITTEHILKKFIPDCDCYLTIYKPLKEMAEKWVEIKEGNKIPLQE